MPKARQKIQATMAARVWSISGSQSAGAKDQAQEKRRDAGDYQ